VWRTWLGLSLLLLCCWRSGAGAGGDAFVRDVTVPCSGRQPAEVVHGSSLDTFVAWAGELACMQHCDGCRGYCWLDCQHTRHLQMALPLVLLLVLAAGTWCSSSSSLRLWCPPYSTTTPCQ
jgi:hypothetical protein